MFERTDPSSACRPVVVKNTSSSEAPAYAALQVIGIETGSGPGSPNYGAIRVDKPSADSLDPNLVLINGPVPIAAGEYGQAFMESIYPVRVYTSGTPAATGLAFGDQLGTVSGQWYLQNDRFGFRAWGDLYDYRIGDDTRSLALACRGYRSLVDIACVSNVLTGTKPSSGGGNG